MASTIHALCAYRVGKSVDSDLNGADFHRADLPIMGGCEGCGAMLAAYNAYPSKSGYIRCRDCLGDLGWETAKEANDAIFEGVTVYGPH